MVDAFRTASVEGWNYAMNHPDEAIDIILTKYNTQSKTKEALESNQVTIIEKYNN